jgi:hypothetical protein
MSGAQYSIALRCIAQDLVRRGMKIFEIKPEGSHFVVSCGDSETLADAMETLRYTPADIEFLDRAGESQRGKKAQKEFLHQAQMLRAIGDYLDKYDSILIRIAKNGTQPTDCPFRVEYRTRESDLVIDDRPGAAIFDMCVLMVQKRRQQTPAGVRAVSGRR